ncbi:hypothetical protein [Deinococcus planocerae]|uniref:hypothetical protein n=1 Tax=Deinococcus planocerae TaxID=1737569 RepID=UPI000C7EA2E2|nr:hypothetical protein [Deinococcus planocerae]
MILPTPSALDFARLLRTRAELEARAGPYLAVVQEAVGAALERRGYEAVHVKRALDVPAQESVAADVTLVAIARLPLEGLRTPVLKALVPMVVTYSERFVVRDAQINRFCLPEPFIQPVTLDPARIGDDLVQFLSERYMAHLLRQP